MSSNAWTRRRNRLPFGPRDRGPGDAVDIDALCDSILVDASVRRQRNQEVTLSWYFATIPGLQSHPVVLDTALRTVLDEAEFRGRDRDAAAAELGRQFPELAEAIGFAQILDRALGSSSDFSRLLEPVYASLPCDFGPPWRGGEHRFSLTDRVAAGAHGVVFRAYDRSLSSDGRTAWAAVKILSGPDDGAVLARREAIRARVIDHPAVARVLAAGEVETGGSFIAFEFVDGQPLRAWREQNPALCEPHTAVKFGLRIAEGLEAAHSSGVTHGDLHPGNVLVTSSGLPKIVDFGLGLVSPDSLVSGHSKGALGFIPPECWNGARVDPRSADVFGFAALLYWIICGVPPNGATVDDAELLLEAGGRSAAQITSELMGRGIDRDLSRIIARALDADPKARCPSMSAVISDLVRWQRHEPIVWSNPSAIRRARLAIRRAPLVAALGATGFVVALGGVAAATGISMRGRAAIAEQAAATAKAEANTLRVESDKYQQSRLFSRGLLNLVNQVPTDKPEPRWLLLLSLLDHLFAAEGGSLTLAERRLDRQIMLARQMRDDTQTLEGECSIAAVMWDAALGRWLLEANQFEEAGRVLAPAYEHAQLYFGGDPMVQRIEAMMDIATVLGSEPEETNPESVEQAVDRLRTADLSGVPEPLLKALHVRLAKPTWTAPP